MRYRNPKFKKRYIALALLGLYVIFCQSCMTMRTGKRGTRAFFEDAKVPYVDSVRFIENHPIHFIKTGSDNSPTLFFIHGSPGSWDAFKNYLKDSLLLKKYRLIAIDRPGFGYSEFGSATNLQTQSDRISAFIALMDNEQPIALVGHSLGGPIVAKLGAMHPEWNAHLVIISGSLDPKAESSESWRRYLMAKPLRWLVPGALRPSNDELFYFKKDVVALEYELGKISSPLTIIHGTNDRLVPYDNVGFMVQKFKAAQSISVHTFEGADHFIPWTDFEEIRDVLLGLKLK